MQKNERNKKTTYIESAKKGTKATAVTCKLLTQTQTPWFMVLLLFVASESLDGKKLCQACMTVVNRDFLIRQCQGAVMNFEDVETI